MTQPNPEFTDEETNAAKSPLIVNNPADLPAAELVENETPLWKQNAWEQEVPALPRSGERRRVDMEAELTSEKCAGFQILRVNDAELSEVLAFQFDVPRDDQEKRDFGKVRITIERISE